MGINQPWNRRVTILKTIKMKLVRPPVTNLKMTVRADSAVSTGNPLPLSIKALVRSFSREQAVCL